MGSKLNLEYFRYLAEMPDMRMLFRKAINFLSRRLELGRCFVSFSAGKDSTVCADLANRVCPGIPMLMVDPGGPTHWLGAEREKFLKFAHEKGWNLRLFPWDKWRIGWHGEETSSLHVDMFRELNDYAKKEGYSTLIMGIREKESKNRKILAKMRGDDYQRKDGMRVLLPVMRWSSDAIWAYTVSRGLPWLSIYDTTGKDARNGLVGVNGHRFGRMGFLKQYYPMAYEFAKRLIEAGKMDE